VDLDFGRIGLAICFDANFPGVWQNLHDLGAELVVWSSAYSAGMQLAAYSLVHHYPIATSTMVPDAALYDIDGREVLYKRGGAAGAGDGRWSGWGAGAGGDAGPGINTGPGDGASGDANAGGDASGDICTLEYTLDLDRCIFHYNFNQDKACRLIEGHGAEIEVEKDYWREQWFILRSKSEGASARGLAASYGMEELNAYQKRSREEIDAMRINL